MVKKPGKMLTRWRFQIVRKRDAIADVLFSFCYKLGEWMNRWLYFIDVANAEHVGLSIEEFSKCPNSIYLLINNFKITPFNQVLTLYLWTSHRWSSGTMGRCHRLYPGSIPGRCITFLQKQNIRLITNLFLLLFIF